MSKATAKTRKLRNEIRPPKKKELSLYEKAAAAQRLRANPPSLIERLEKIEAFLFGGQNE